MSEIVIGLLALKKKLSKMSAKIQNEVKMQVLDSATQIELDAIRNAPTELFLINGKTVNKDGVDFGQKIDKTIIKNGFAADVAVQGKSNIPIYIEFGTGTDAAQYVPTLPKDIQAYARTFYKNGKGRIKKQPYLIPAYLKESPIFIKELKKILKENV